MNYGNKPYGPTGNEKKSENPYGSLIGNPFTDSGNLMDNQKFFSNTVWETRDYPASRPGRPFGLYDQSFDYGLNRGRWKRAYTRVIHLSPNAPSFDIYLDGRLFYSGLSYRMQSDYIRVRPGNHRMVIYPSGYIRNPVFYKTLFVPRRSIVSFVLCAMYTNLDVLVVDDRTVIPPGRVKVKFVHLSPNSPAIDLLAGKSVWFNQIMYQEESEYIPTTAGREALSVRVSGTQQILLTVPNTQFTRNKAYTIYAIGILNGSQPLQLLVTQDGSGKLQVE